MNISKIRENANNLLHTQLFWIQACALGIWLLVIQNFFVGEDTAQLVYVVGGNISADVNGSVDVCNTVDINIESVNGHRNAFYGPNYDGSYDAIHVYTGR